MHRTGPAAERTKMRRVVVHADRIEVVTDAAVPAPGPREVLVRSVVTGICGSDTHAAHGRHPFIPIPYHPGHEAVGVVAAWGVDVRDIAVGQRVTVEPDLPCWTCKMCITGRQNLCEHLQFFGCGWEQGGMADYFTIASDRLHAVPDGLDDTTAALIEPLSTPVHAVRLAGNGALDGVAGKAAVVLGAGTIGLLLVGVLKASGIGRVVVTDVLENKRSRARALGADAVVDASAEDLVDQVRTALGESADIVFDCVAIQPTVTAAIALASKGGTVVVVGVPSADVSIPLAIVQDHQIRIQGSATYLPEDYQDSIRLLGSGAIKAADIVTASLPMDQVAEAFDLSLSGDHIKVLLTIDGTGARL
ncbi:alcohol dehydrogenase catalytic domain-containing protein [Acidothermaceae bacterium B102]|nr:alcohol dehydrogenase catalytic domain-containing protein [Acidothermaceae bacterium B102]